MRLFVAVHVPEEVAARLGPSAPPNPHVTLRFLGEVDDALVDEVADALRASLAGVPACEAVVGTTVRRLGMAAYVVPVSGLDEVAAAVARGVGRYGGDDRPFRGHLTIARRRRGAPAPDVVGPTEELRWAVGGVALVRSELGRGPGGTARHVDVAVAPLSDRT